MRRALAVAVAAVLLAPASAAAGPTVVDTIAFPDDQPVSVGVYETGNKVFIAEDDAGLVHILDGTTHESLGTVAVGGSALDIAVNETYGKVYVGSDKGFSTGLTEGNGKISVIDADTNALLSQFLPAGQGNFSQFEFAADEVRDKVYVGYYGGTGVIDVATDGWTVIAGAPTLPTALDVNTVTNEVHVVKYNTAALTTIDGADLSVSSAPFPEGASGPLDVAVNEVENKVYLTLVTVPGQAQMGIMIDDLDTDGAIFVGASDLEPLVFNQASNTLFSGVQVGSTGGIVDGATDAFLPLTLGASGIGAAGVRSASDNAYFASAQAVAVVSGRFECTKLFIPAPGIVGGLIVSDIDVNQTTGRVYVINRHTAAQVTVLQDGGPACVPVPAVASASPPSPANDNTVQVTGTAPPGADVEVYTAPNCIGGAAAAGTATEFAAGLTVTVPDDSTTTIRARATATDATGSTASDCSPTSVTYIEDSTPPSAPSIALSDPAGPANWNTPVLRGAAEPGSTVRLYESADCSGAIAAQGPASQFAAGGLQVTVADDSTTAFSATATDGAGNTSGCSLAFSFVEDSTAPAAPLPSTSVPASPANFNSPSVQGTAEPGSTVRLYAQPGCTGPVVGSGLAVAFLDPGLQVPVDDDSTTSFQAKATDAAGNESGCSGNSVTFVEDSTAPPATIDSGPFGPVTAATVSFVFSSGEAGASFECRIDGAPFAACTSPFTVTLTAGGHYFEVRATDAAGNTGPGAAGQAFSITPAPTPSPTPFPFPTAAPSPAPTPRPDTAVVLSASARSPQRPLAKRRVVVSARCPAEACTVRASGYVRLKRFTLRAVTRRLEAGTRVQISVRLSRATLREVRRLLSKRRRASARITLRATDAAGNTTSRVVRVTLRR